MATEMYNQDSLFDDEVGKFRKKNSSSKAIREKHAVMSEQLIKPVKSQVPTFDEEERASSCLEINFPIVPINRLARQEGNAGKPVYQMSKWWARRRSSVFRSMLLAAATQAPANEDPTSAAQKIWNVYYANHQKFASFAHLRVLDPFMGGGTTLVEGARLGMQMYGMDLNPVAWLVVKNELAASDPKMVQAFFNSIETEVKPQIQPFYTTSCPRGHHGQWIDTRTDEPATVDPITFSPQERLPYKWQGPEIIYTFWAKHCPCPATGCGHRTPIFKTLLIAEKKLTTNYLALHCDTCHLDFDAELGATRMAPDAQRVVLSAEKPFTETAQELAQHLLNYDKGTPQERHVRKDNLMIMIPNDPGLHCPKCGAFAAHALLAMLSKHTEFGVKETLIKKKDLQIQRKNIYMRLLLHPDWLQGSPDTLHGTSLGGFAGADPEASAAWYRARAANLSLIEVRGRAEKDLHEGATDEIAQQETPADSDTEAIEADIAAEQYDTTLEGLPHIIALPDGTMIDINKGTVPEQSTCSCMACGRSNDLLTAMKASGQTAPTMAYALQCYCPACDAEGYNYGGRFFKAPDAEDIGRLIAADAEWARCSQTNLNGFWPLEPLPYAHMTYERQPLPQNGYTHWWKMFNPRQLLVHASLLRSITIADPKTWPQDIREQALGAFQQYLRNQNMFAFWHIQKDHFAPMFGNPHYHSKPLTIEVSLNRGYGSLSSVIQSVVEGLSWCQDPWESFLDDDLSKSEKIYAGDGVSGGQSTVYCGSSTDLPLEDAGMDMVITDPPFGDNVFYADLADFFYVWLRIPLLRWYVDQPQAEYFRMPATPKALEAITNRAEHPDIRSSEEKKQSASRPPADEFYQHTLTACWAEAHRVLKPGGILAFTFHHSAHEPWINVLESLFEAGFILVATYPIRSDESKGENAQFGSKKIEYDIIHVCRKRLPDTDVVSWVRMRAWVRKEVTNLRRMLETYHKEELLEADIRVILRGKALEYYSRYYGHVMNTSHELLSIRDALIGINNLLDEILLSDSARPPDINNEITRLFLSIFAERTTLSRDELHKMLGGNIVDSKEFLDRGWLKEGPGKRVYIPSIEERLKDLRKPGRRRDTIKSDLDQAHFFIGAALKDSGIEINQVLLEGKIPLHDDIEVLLTWYASQSREEAIRDAAARAQRLITAWRMSKKERRIVQQPSLFEEELE